MTTTERKDFYRKGYSLSCENSKALSQIAIISANERTYGIACSLNILAAEEAIKSALLLINSFLLNIEIVDLRKIFIDHKIKHKLIRDHIELFDNFFDQDKIFYANYNKLFELIDILPECITSQIPYDVEFLKRTKGLTEQYDLSKEEIKEAIKWTEKVNTIKKRGFYVDLVDNNWLSPQDLMFEQFEKESKYTAALQKWVQVMQYIFDTPGIDRFIDNTP